ncbi:MAG: hypothetical protein H5T96_00545 [Tissierellales bacterium]|nr:hypothetical protein [Tissierellales bacterium]
MKKLILLLSLLISTSALAGCQPMNSNSKTNDRYILNKMLPHEIELPLRKDYLEQEENKKIIEKYLNLLNSSFDLNLENYDIGDLNGDGIDEIAMYFTETTGKENIGKLLVYSYDGNGYFMIDEVEIKYDKENLDLKIGEIYEGKQGIILKNLANENTSVIYVYSIEDGKIVEAINPKKVNLFSIDINNEIRDIDGDGILNFNIYTFDPEANSDQNSKISIWYKCEEKGSATVVKKENLNENNINDKISVEKLEAFGEISNIDDLRDIINYTEKNEFSNVLYEYLNKLNESLDIENKHLSNYLYNIDRNELDRFYDEKVLSRINNLETGINISSNISFNSFLTESIQKGYMLTIENNRIVLKINYDKFIKIFGDSLTNELKTYINIISLYQNKPSSNLGVITVDKREIALRLVEIEKFRMVFPYSNMLDEVLEIYEKYINDLLFLERDERIVEMSEYKIDQTYKNELLEIKEEFAQTYFSELIERMLILVDGIGGGAITPTIKDYIRDII